MSDETRKIVERLYDTAVSDKDLGHRAADLIERLEAENERLRKLADECAKNCMGGHVEGVRQWVAKERLDAAEAELARMREGAIEGSAFKDGDMFCPEESCDTHQESWVFVPFCMHDQEVDYGEKPALLILEPENEDD